MLLCDIGNTSYHFFDGIQSFKRDVNSFDPATIAQDVSYICVHPHIAQKVSSLPNWRNLEPFVDRSRYYDTMGIDRIMACEAVENGVIVDAGSAITVDIMQDALYQGGFIYPGIKSFHKAYASISPLLAQEFDFSLRMDFLPKNTSHALTYGFLSGLVKEILSYELDIIVTGGDANLIASFLPDSRVEEHLLFFGMQKVAGGFV